MYASGCGSTQWDEAQICCPKQTAAQPLLQIDHHIKDYLGHIGNICRSFLSYTWESLHTKGLQLKILKCS